jgi:hypothetical protein
LMPPGPRLRGTPDFNPRWGPNSLMKWGPNRLIKTPGGDHAANTSVRIPAVSAHAAQWLAPREFARMNARHSSGWLAIIA